MSARRLVRAVDQYAPPVRNARFWVVQGLIMLIFWVHQIVSGALGTPAIESLPHMAVDALYLVPVLYAALTFSLPGALGTAAWVTVLIVIDVAVSPVITEPDMVRHGVILVIVDMVAAFVGVRMKAEVSARARLEEAEGRYRSLFATNSNPVLVLDESGVVREANDAAAAVLGFPETQVRGARLGELVGPDLALRITAGPPEPFHLPSRRGADLLVYAARTPVRQPAGQRLVQVVLQDVTVEARRRERAEAYAVAVLQAQEDERLRLARELHDDTIQELIQLGRQLDQLEADYPHPAGREAMSDVRALAEGIISGVRDIARGLRPSVLDDLGLATALRRLCREAGDRSGLDVHAEIEEPGPLPPPVQLVIFRVAQEALSNVERHSGARQVTVGLWRGSAGVALKVADDGRGFQAPEVLDDGVGQGLGLRGMAERARLVGGTIRIESRPDRGTTLRLLVPVER